MRTDRADLRLRAAIRTRAFVSFPARRVAFPGGSRLGLALSLSLSLSLVVAACAATSPLTNAARQGRSDDVGQLIASGADVDERGRGGNTPLYYAALHGHADVVRQLIEAGADVDVDNDFGSTPLHVAARAGHVDVIRALAEGGANLDAVNLSGATSANDLAARSAIQASGLRSSSPLAKAARAGQLEAVKALVELGATLPAPDAVEQASLKGHDEIARYLVQATSDRRRLAANAPATPSAPAPGRTLDLSPSYGRRHAVVIGISRYQRMTGLEGARRDAEETAKLLRALGFDSVHELYDEDATRTGILDLVGQRLRREVGEEDLVFVYYAGHGATETLPSGEKRGYLVPTEGSSEDPYVTGISMETVRDLSNRLPARHVYYAIDACYSGGLLQRARSELSGEGGDRRRAVQVLTAGLEGQQAIERDGRGLFTTFLLEALRGEADANGDAEVTASELGWFVARRVGEVSHGRQTPAYGHLGGTGEISFRLR